GRRSTRECAAECHPGADDAAAAQDLAPGVLALPQLLDLDPEALRLSVLARESLHRAEKWCACHLRPLPGRHGLCCANNAAPGSAVQCPPRPTARRPVRRSGGLFGGCAGATLGHVVDRGGHMSATATELKNFVDGNWVDAVDG